AAPARGAQASDGRLVQPEHPALRVDRVAEAVEETQPDDPVEARGHAPVDDRGDAPRAIAGDREVGEAHERGGDDAVRGLQGDAVVGGAETDALDELRGDHAEARARVEEKASAGPAVDGDAHDPGAPVALERDLGARRAGPRGGG